MFVGLLWKHRSDCTTYVLYVDLTMHSKYVMNSKVYDNGDSTLVLKVMRSNVEVNVVVLVYV